jgi:RNA chaperone Hfq
MNKLPVNIQDSFFHALRNDQALVEVVLVNGETRIGHLKRFDRFAIVVEISSHEELIYKHAIASIRMSAPGPGVRSALTAAP